MEVKVAHHGILAVCEDVIALIKIILNHGLGQHYNMGRYQRVTFVGLLLMILHSRRSSANIETQKRKPSSRRIERPHQNYALCVPETYKLHFLTSETPIFFPPLPCEKVSSPYIPQPLSPRSSSISKLHLNFVASLVEIKSM